MRRGISAALVNDLAGAPNLYAQSVDSFDGAYGMQASQVLQGYFVERQGRVELHVAVQNLAAAKTAQVLTAEGAAAQGAIPLVNQIAKKLSPAARDFPSTNETAFKDYGEALRATDRASMLSALEAAASEDPQLSMAYLDRAEVLARGGDREGALRVIEAGKRTSPDPIQAAKFDYVAALARGDAAAREKSLEALSRLTPADAKIVAELGELQVAQRKFADAARSYEQASRLNPQNDQPWNELGYARAYAGDLAGARSALEQYQKLLPEGNANALDSLGEVSFYRGDFAAAEKYFLEADQKNRAEFGGVDLLKAAQARLFAGDLAAADGIFHKYLGLLDANQRSRAVYLEAQWEFLTGRRRAAMSALEKVIPALEGEGRALALIQLSLWKSETGDAKTGSELAAQAAQIAASPATRNLSILCRVIAKPDVVPTGSRLADAYALMFAKKFAEAGPLFESTYRETNPHNDGQIRTLLAWTYVKTNRARDAEALTATYPIPLSSGEPMLASLIFPRFLFVRAAVLEQQGKRAEAKTAYELFLKYAGDAPDVFGDEEAARKSLGKL